MLSDKVVNAVYKLAALAPLDAAELMRVDNAVSAPTPQAAKQTAGEPCTSSAARIHCGCSSLQTEGAVDSLTHCPPVLSADAPLDHTFR